MTSQWNPKKRFRASGIWWVPGSELQRTGTLKCDSDGIRLRVSDFLHNPTGRGAFDLRPEDVTPEVIHGKTTGGEEVTVCKSWYQHWQPLSFFGKSVAGATLVGQVALIGGHFSALTSQLYKSCSFDIPNLDSWIAFQAFQQSSEGEPGGESYLTRTSLPPSKEFRVSFGVIGLFAELSFRGAGTKVTIHVQWRLSIEPDDPQTLDWFMKRMRHAERLFALLFGSPVSAENAIFHPVSTEDVENSFAVRSKMGARVYTRQKRPKRKRLRSFDFLITYQSIEDILPEVFKEWFSDTKDIDHALTLFFVALFFPASYLETRFLPVIQSLEVIARETFKDTYTTTESANAVFASMLKAIPEGTPPGLSKSIEGRLGYANEVTLKDRLNRLIDRLEEPTRKLFCVDVRAFVKGIVDTRNFHTHYSASSGRVLREMDMHWATLKMQVLMTILLLRRAGLPESLIRDSIAKHHRMGLERGEWRSASEKGDKVAT